MFADETVCSLGRGSPRAVCAGVMAVGLVLATLSVTPSHAACASGEVRRSPADNPDSGDMLIGQPAPGWAFTRWVRGGPMTLAQLRGKVVLLRWWTEGCHFCESTLPEIESLRQRYGDDGLVVIGVFHPKPPKALSDTHILSVARKLGYAGPVAFDQNWSTLDRYWLDRHPERNWTSVSFLIDRDGRFAWVHGGGEYHRSSDPRHATCDAEYHALEDAIVSALGTSAAAAE